MLNAQLLLGICFAAAVEVLAVEFAGTSPFGSDFALSGTSDKAA